MNVILMYDDDKKQKKPCDLLTKLTRMFWLLNAIVFAFIFFVYVFHLILSYPVKMDWFVQAHFNNQ